MRKLYYSIVNEFIKNKNTPSLYLSLIGALLVHLLFFCMYFFKTKHFITDLGVNPWDIFIQKSFSASTFMLMPLYIILITSMLLQTEHKSKAWKQLFVMPVSKASLFFSKLLSIISLLAFTFILFDVFLIASGYLLGVLRPELKFLDFPVDYKIIMNLTIKLFMLSFSIIGIQYFLSLIFKNIIVPVGVGIAMVISGFILIGWDKIIYFPYVHHFVELSKHYGKINISNDVNPYAIELSSFAILFVALVSSFLYFNKKSISN